ncbi:hypothetical protein Tco_1097034, partial [Tanacetum coccineum]
MRILSVVSVHVEKRSGYGYLKEIVVRHAAADCLKQAPQPRRLCDCGLHHCSQNVYPRNRCEEQEPTSNKLYGRSDAYAGNPVKEILLNLNLPDH